MPYICHTHKGLYVEGEDEGCQHKTCIDLRNNPIEPRIHFSVSHLRRQNAEGVTTAEEVRDVLSNVKPEDREKIARV